MDNLTTDRPLPTPTLDSEPYWRSAKEHALRMQHCTECSTWRFYPTPVCPQCASLSATWDLVSGFGRIHSFTHVHRPAAPAFAARSPITLLLVTLDEGPTMMGDLMDTGKQVQIGDEVKVDYTDINETITLPGFRLV